MRILRLKAFSQGPQYSGAVLLEPSQLDGVPLAHLKRQLHNPLRSQPRSAGGCVVEVQIIACIH